jgi:integrase/recombinase XerD
MHCAAPIIDGDTKHFTFTKRLHKMKLNITNYVVLMMRTGRTGQARVLDEKELKQVLKIIEVGSFAKRNAAIVIFSNYLGLRAKELSALNVGDVVEQNGTAKKVLRLFASYTKNNVHRDVSLENKAVVRAISELIAEIGLANLQRPLFCSQRGVRFEANGMVHLMKAIYKKAGFEGATSHSGRRSLITKLAYKGVDINSIRQIAGHSSISTTQRYIDDNPFLIADILKSI